MHAQPSVLAAALEAHEGAIGYSRPLRVFAVAINADLRSDTNPGSAPLCCVQRISTINIPCDRAEGRPADRSHVRDRNFQNGTLLSGLLCKSLSILKESALAIAPCGEAAA